MASVNVDVGVTPETTYSISGKQIKFDSKSDIESYLKEMSQVKILKKINFSGNTIGIEASESLAQAIIAQKDHIVEIDFSDLYTGRLNTEIPQSLDYLLPALLQCENLRILNLSDNAFGLQTIDPIEDYLNKAVSLEHLILSNNGMGPFAGARIGKSLFRLSIAKQKNPKAPQSLKTFICGRNRLENGSINYLSIGLRSHKNLEVVKLYQNGIRPTGATKLIAFGLSYNKNLKIVDLQDNTLTKKASVALAHALPKWSYLEELNVNDCLMNPSGSIELVKALNSGPSKENLATLKLQYNELDVKALEILVEALKNKLPSLKFLELNGNRFEEDTESLKSINFIFEERGYGELDELDELEELDSEDEEEEEEESEEEAEEEEDVGLDQLEKELAESEGLVVKEYSGNAYKNTDLDILTEGLEKVHIKQA